MGKGEIQGMDELLSNLKKLGIRASKIENEALQSGAKVIQKRASQRVSRSFLHKDHLADHITCSDIKKKEGIKYIEVGPERNFFYGKFLEWGTSKMRARPFLLPAAEESKDEVIDRMIAVIRSRLRM
jgi:HK97 gp10 family phage protein